MGDNPKARLPRVRENTDADRTHLLKKRRRWGIRGPQEQYVRCSPQRGGRGCERAVGKCMAELRATGLPGRRAVG